MKKKLFFILSVCVILLTSCHSFEREAHHALRDEIKATAKNPGSYKISNEETIFQQDSMVVISFVGNGENSYGGRTSNRYEFIYGYVSPEKKKAYLREAENNISISTTIRNLELGGDTKEDKIIKGLMNVNKCSKKEAIDTYVSMMTEFLLILKGHNIK